MDFSKTIKIFSDHINKGLFSFVIKRRTILDQCPTPNVELLKLVAYAYDQEALRIKSNSKRKAYQEEALKFFTLIKKQDPKLPDGYKGIGVVYQHQGEYAKAIRYYKKALSLKNNDPTIYISLGNGYQAIKKYRPALYWYKKSLDHSKQKEHPLFNLVMLYNKLGNTEKVMIFGTRFMKTLKRKGIVVSSDRIKMVEKLLKTLNPGKKM